MSFVCVFVPVESWNSKESKQPKDLFSIFLMCDWLCVCVGGGVDVCQGEKAAGALGEEEDAGLHLGSTNGCWLEKWRR